MGAAGASGTSVAQAQVKTVAKETHLTDTQVSNARTIIGVAVAQKLPRRAAVIAVATAMTESHLRNHKYGDRDSEGLFQQRPSCGWGSPKQITNPDHAAKAFLGRLAKVHNWKKLPLTLQPSKAELVHLADTAEAPAKRAKYLRMVSQLD